MAAALAVQLLDADRIVDGLLPLVSQHALLKAWQHRRVGVLQESDDHQRQSVRAEVAVCGADDADGLGPPFQEDVHDVEALVDLHVREDQIRVGDSEQVVDVEVDLDSGLVLDELEDGDAACWHVGECALARDLGDDLAAHFDQLVVVVSQGVEEDGGDVDVRFLGVPAAVVARAEAGDENLAGDLDWIVLVACFVKGLFDPIDDLVAHLQITLGHHLILIDLPDKLLDDA